MLKNQDAQKFFQGLETEPECQKVPDCGDWVGFSRAVDFGLDVYHSFFRPPVACLSWPSLPSPRLPTPCHLALSLVSFPQPQRWAETSPEAQILQKVPSAGCMLLHPGLPAINTGAKGILGEDSRGSISTEYNSLYCQLIDSRDE